MKLFHKIANNSTATKARENINTHLETLEFKKKNDMCFPKTNNFYLIEFATDFYWQPSYLLGKRATLLKSLAPIFEHRCSLIFLNGLPISGRNRKEYKGQTT